MRSSLYIHRDKCTVVLQPVRVPQWMAEGVKLFKGNYSKMIREFLEGQLAQVGIYRPDDAADRQRMDDEMRDFEDQ